MQIKNMVKTKDPTWFTKAFFSIETKNFLIHGCRLVTGNKGRLVVQMPYKDKLSNPIIHIKDNDYLEAVGEEAVKLYESLKR